MTTTTLKLFLLLATSVLVNCRLHAPREQGISELQQPNRQRRGGGGRRRRPSCTDTDGGATDAYGTTCADYNTTPDFCAYPANDDDFHAEEMCCGCGGGSGGNQGGGAGGEATAAPTPAPTAAVTSGECPATCHGYTCDQILEHDSATHSCESLTASGCDCSGCSHCDSNQAPPTPPPAEECIDDNEHCASWAAGGECDNNPGYMHQTCRASCGICQPAETTAAPASTATAAEGPPWASVGSIPDSCTPDPLVADNYPCLFSSQCQSGYCCPRLKMCLGNSGYSPVPAAVIQQDDHALYRSIVWDPQRPCYSEGCFVCSGSSSNPMSDEYNTCFQNAWFHQETGGFDLNVFDLGNAACDCDPRFVEAWRQGRWVGCSGERQH